MHLKTGPESRFFCVRMREKSALFRMPFFPGVFNEVPNASRQTIGKGRYHKRCHCACFCRSGWLRQPCSWLAKPGVTPIAAEAALANCRREARDRFKESSPEFKNEVTDCMKGQEYRYGSY